MGWDFQKNTKNWTYKEYIEKEIFDKNELVDCVISGTICQDTIGAIDPCTVAHCAVYYGPDDIVCFIILLSEEWETDSSEKWIGHKLLDETMMSPNELNAPKSILDKLTPTDNKRAIKWRMNES